MKLKEANTYNAAVLDEGRLTPQQLSILTHAWQRKSGALEVDGMCGPFTREALDAISTPGSPDSSRMGLKALSVAVSNLGEGEEGGNNSGPFVEMLHKKQFDGDADDDGAWCAAFMSWCFEKVYSAAGSAMPFKRSGSAKRLWKNVGRAGSFPTQPEPGDLVCWDRGKKGSWQGHIGIIERVEGSIIHTVEGNVGSYPSKVRRFMHDLSREDRLEGFARPPS